MDSQEQAPAWFGSVLVFLEARDLQRERMLERFEDMVTSIVDRYEASNLTAIESSDFTPELEEVNCQRLLTSDSVMSPERSQWPQLEGQSDTGTEEEVDFLLRDGVALAVEEEVFIGDGPVPNLVAGSLSGAMENSPSSAWVSQPPVGGIPEAGELQISDEALPRASAGELPPVVFLGRPPGPPTVPSLHPPGNLLTVCPPENLPVLHPPVNLLSLHPPVNLLSLHPPVNLLSQRPPETLLSPRSPENLLNSHPPETLLGLPSPEGLPSLHTGKRPGPPTPFALHPPETLIGLHPGRPPDTLTLPSMRPPERVSSPHPPGILSGLHPSDTRVMGVNVRPRGVGQ